MTDDYHTPYIDGTTEYKADHMNAPLSQLDTSLGEVSGEVRRAHSGEKSYDIGLSYEGSPGAGDTILRFPMVRNINFDIDISGSQAIAGTTATGQAVFSIKKAGVEFATLTWEAGQGSGTFSGESTTFTGSGEVLTIDAPNPADATLADLGIALKGYRW